jgi:hypothetical protein
VVVGLVRQTLFIINDPLRLQQDSQETQRTGGDQGISPRGYATLASTEVYACILALLLAGGTTGVHPKVLGWGF